MERVRAIVKPTQINLVVYHGQCSDGTAAAACAYVVHGDSISYYAPTRFIRDGETDDTLLSMLNPESNVLIVDYTSPPL